MIANRSESVCFRHSDYLGASRKSILQEGSLSQLGIIKACFSSVILSDVIISAKIPNPKLKYQTKSKTQMLMLKVSVFAFELDLGFGF